MLLLIISVNNLTRYDVIVWEFALCIFNLRDQPTKREDAPKTINFGKHLYIFVYLMFKTRYVNAVKTSLSIYSIHPNFPIFFMKMIKFYTLQTVTSTMSKKLSRISKKYILQFSFVFKICELAVNFEICSVTFELVIEF